MFTLLYGAGLRVSEMLHLEPADIDSQRMVVHVRDIKNRHDRIVPLPPIALETLRVKATRGSSTSRGRASPNRYLFCRLRVVDSEPRAAGA